MLFRLHRVFIDLFIDNLIIKILKSKTNYNKMYA